MAPSFFTSRRFLPLFLAQTLGALNDNLFKNALVLVILFRAGETGGAPLVALTGAFFILPYAIFSATAGQLADRFDKARLIRLTKLFEVVLMAGAAYGFLFSSLDVLMGVLVGLGIQASFFGPLKYGILPEQLAEPELVDGNALIEAGTFAGILVGTIAGGAFIGLDNGAAIVAAAGLVVAIAGAVAAFRVPDGKPAAPGLAISWNIPRETISLLRQARANQPVWFSILGLSWFWTFGLILLAEFPIIAKDTLAADSSVVTLLLTVFAIGVGFGSILCGRLLKGEVTVRHVPFAVLGLSLFAGDFAIACAHAGTLADTRAVLGSFQGWRLLIDLFLTAACGGVFSVPLYVTLQEESDPSHRSRMIAANNVANAVLMVAGGVVTAIMAMLGLSAPMILALTALANLFVAIQICRLLPHEMMRAALRWYFETLHGVEISGIEHYREAGPRRVVICNHLSFLDGCFVAAYLPGNVTFAVNTFMTRVWWARVFLAFVRIFPVDPSNPFGIKAMIKTVRDGIPLGIFPEGRLSTTGALMKIYEGAATVADRSDAEVIPIRIDGLQFTPFTRMGHKVRRRWFPKLKLQVLPPVKLSLDPTLRGRKRRQVVGTALQDLMVATAFATHNTDRTLFSALLDARARFGRKLPIVEDTDRKPLSYDRLVLGAVILGRKLAALTKPGERVGVLLPNSAGAVATFFALQSQERVPAMLNFSAGADGMLSACMAAEIKTVLCSRKFVERGKLDKVIEQLGEQVKLVWLEDVRASIGIPSKLAGMVRARFPRRLPGAKADPDAPAVVLFTSGSEGTPKGVVLSHRNIIANCGQVASVIDFNPADRVMNAMPMFHSFGLTGGTILPLLHGVRTFFYPSPLHYKIVPDLIYDTDATIVFGTDTFLTGWARFAHPYDFYAVRYAFAGAEKVRDETRRLFSERFGVRILEGYGATETAPVLAINSAMHSRPGTVGRFLPGIEWRLEPVPGVAEGGRLFVRGPNIMLGYFRTTAPGLLEAPEAGWYDTGDIVRVDELGFVAIQGRAKRFAKIAGEMVSMTAAETLAAQLWPDEAHAVIALPDARKGEQLVLVTTRKDAEAKTLLAFARERGITELMVPRALVKVDAIPLLGTGKVDYPSVERLAGELAAAGHAASERQAS
ncbi:MAG TPA: acyl-[ACP]--phospholipid O-acyltransferase [Aliidongia sp.]|nr:acyl-[ACP]--phospholipid O-acyltransferase [Aliidongia sp.]